MPTVSPLSWMGRPAPAISFPKRGRGVGVRGAVAVAGDNDKACMDLLYMTVEGTWLPQLADAPRL